MTEQTPTPDDDLDDDLELELEPIDPEILELQRRRTIEQTRKAEDSVDINEAYGSTDPDDIFELKDLKKFRFSIRHLLILTALLSISMAVFTQLGLCLGTIIIFALTVSSAWWFIIGQERQQQNELTRQQQKKKARIAAQRAAEDGDSNIPITEPAEIAFDPPPERPSFRFSFSLKEMLGAFTAAAIVLGLVNFAGGGSAAVVLGMIALVGLVMHAVGFEPPPLVVLGWWILLVLYILVGIVTVFRADQAAIAAPPLPFEHVLALTSTLSNLLASIGTY